MRRRRGDLRILSTYLPIHFDSDIHSIHRDMLSIFLNCLLAHMISHALILPFLLVIIRCRSSGAHAKEHFSLTIVSKID